MKNKAWIQYTKSGKLVPGSLIVSPTRPKNGVWYEVIENICCDNDPAFGQISSKKKAFVKYSKDGHIVPGSLIITNSQLPKPGIWKEVYINKCCEVVGGCVTFVIDNTTPNGLTNYIFIEVINDGGAPVTMTVTWGDGTEDTITVNADPGNFGEIGHLYATEEIFNGKVCFDKPERVIYFEMYQI